MSKTWVHRALEGGRAFHISFSENQETWYGTLSREFLDDELGDAASETERREWLAKNEDQIFLALKAKSEGGFVRAPADSQALHECVDRAWTSSGRAGGHVRDDRGGIRSESAT